MPLKKEAKIEILFILHTKDMRQTVSVQIIYRINIKTRLTKSLLALTIFAVSIFVCASQAGSIGFAEENNF